MKPIFKPDNIGTCELSDFSKAETLHVSAYTGKEFIGALVSGAAKDKIIRILKETSEDIK